jgi:transcriptional regulator with XRE-family HTH domain
MSTKIRAVEEARLRGRRKLIDIGDELREARLRAGLRQVDVGAAIGVTHTKISLTERGRLESLAVLDLAGHAAAVGLDLSVRFFPRGPALRDAAQLGLLERFRRRLASAWEVRLEVPIAGDPRDRRAWDMTVNREELIIGVEAISRLRDVQAQLRAAQLKREATPGSRLVLLVGETRNNRLAVAAVAPLLHAAFPVSPRVALGALGAGTDPGGDALILL